MDQYMEEARIEALEFECAGSVTGLEELLSGHINQTYRVLTDSGRSYLLQRVNGYVFKDPVAVMSNIERVTAHLKNSLISDGLSPERRVLEPIPAKAGGLYVLDGGGNFWRAYDFIENATAYNQVTDPNQLYEAGRAFGEFQRRLSDFPARELNETIPHFHDTPYRIRSFERAVQEALPERAGIAADDIAFVLARKNRADEITRLLGTDEMPLRVTHNDTKINNAMLDDTTGEALAVIDLDTVMPGSALYDFGDAIRFGAATAVEDEEDTGKMKLDIEKYRLFTRGFLREVGSFLTETEKKMLPVGAWMMTYEMVLRFLADYLVGDPYFKVDYEKHNLVRSRAQAALLLDMEARVDEMSHLN